MQKTEETLEQTELQDKNSYILQQSQHRPQQTQQQSYQQSYQQRSSQSFIGDETKGEEKFSSWNGFKTWMIQWRGNFFVLSCGVLFRDECHTFGGLGI